MTSSGQLPRRFWISSTNAARSLHITAGDRFILVLTTFFNFLPEFRRRPPLDLRFSPDDLDGTFFGFDSELRQKSLFLLFRDDVVSFDGVGVSSDEARVSPDGAVVFNDGGGVSLDGIEVSPDGTGVSKDGVGVSLYGVEVSPDGTRVSNNGAGV